MCRVPADSLLRDTQTKKRGGEGRKPQMVARTRRLRRLIRQHLSTTPTHPPIAGKYKKNPTLRKQNEPPHDGQPETTQQATTGRRNTRVKQIPNNDSAPHAHMWRGEEKRGRKQPPDTQQGPHDGNQPPPTIAPCRAGYHTPHRLPRFTVTGTRHGALSPKGAPKHPVVLSDT